MHGLLSPDVAAWLRRWHCQARHLPRHPQGSPSATQHWRLQKVKAPSARNHLHPNKVLSPAFCCCCLHSLIKPGKFQSRQLGLPYSTAPFTILALPSTRLASDSIFMSKVWLALGSNLGFFIGKCSLVSTRSWGGIGAVNLLLGKEDCWVLIYCTEKVVNRNVIVCSFPAPVPCNADEEGFYSLDRAGAHAGSTRPSSWWPDYNSDGRSE